MLCPIMNIQIWAPISVSSQNSNSSELLVMANVLFFFSKANITWTGLSIVYSTDVQLVLYKPAMYSLKKYII